MPTYLGAQAQGIRFPRLEDGRGRDWRDFGGVVFMLPGL